MANISTINKIMAFTPHAEMIVRRIYRNKYLNGLLRTKKKAKTKVRLKEIDFSKVMDYLHSLGINDGDIVIIHSAFRPLKGAGLSPIQIVDQLIHLVGKEGTLAMPVIRKYPESPPESEALTAEVSNIEFTYNVKESKVWTGIIPKTFMNKKHTSTSRFPLNTLTALGPLAEKMMANNLEGDLPTPNGVNSSWKFCTDHNAWIISIGTDLTHSLTMIHTAEDVKKEKWPVKGWYRKKKFKIIDGDFETEKIVLERHPKWGMLHFGERKLSDDLLKRGVMKSTQIEGVLIESMRSKPLFDFLNSKNDKGYPYFWLGKSFNK